jgi:hypothetical protein
MFPKLRQIFLTTHCQSKFHSLIVCQFSTNWGLDFSEKMSYFIYETNQQSYTAEVVPDNHHRSVARGEIANSP